MVDVVGISGVSILCTSILVNPSNAMSGGSYVALLFVSSVWFTIDELILNVKISSAPEAIVDVKLHSSASWLPFHVRN